MVNPIKSDPMYETKLHVRELARRSGLLLDNDEILVIYQNVRYTLNQKYEILTQMKATEFEKRMFEAARPLWGKRPGEICVSVSPRSEHFESMVECYMNLQTDKVKELMQPITDSILNGILDWRKKNKDVVPVKLWKDNE